MKRLSTRELSPGMVLAANVLNLQQQQIIARGTILTDKLIMKLDLYGILSVYVDDKILVTDAPSSIPDDSSYAERVRKSPAFLHFKEDYELNVDFFRNAMNNVAEKNIQLDASALLKKSLNLVADSKGKPGIFDMLHNMRDYDDSTYAHCMNVALICNVLAGWLKFEQSDVELATACGLFHDIGKLLVPHDIISKPGKLSAEEYSLIQKHPTDGYRMLLNQDVDDNVRFAALMHHERCDGTGYPMHLKGDEINKFARIVAIADVYDAMTAARVYRPPLCPFRVIEIFESEGYERYDTQYMLTFLENVLNTYIQNRCRLSDGREGEIIYINKQKFSRPVVKCGEEYVDLAAETQLSITELL